MPQPNTLSGLPAHCDPVPQLPTDSANGMENVFPLALPQESLWFVDQIAPGSSAYNLPEAWRLAGPLDVAALQQSLDFLVARHETLRTVFQNRGGKPAQVILSPRPFAFQMVDLARAQDPEKELQAHLHREATRPFDLRKGPLARAVLFRLGEDHHVLVFNLHHIIGDEWSVGILLRECAELYNALAFGTTPSLPALPIQYADFAVWQRNLGEEVLAEDLLYWKQQLHGQLAPTILAPDKAGAALACAPGACLFQGATQFFSIPSETAAQLKRLSRDNGVTLFMTLLAAFQTLLQRYTRQSDILVGSPMANRGIVETEALIGLFVNTHALRTDLTGDPSFVELLGRVREVVLGAYAHQSAPADRVIEMLKPARQGGSHPLFRVVFGLQTASTESWPLAKLKTSRIEVDNGGSKFDWTLLVTETAEGFRCRSEYSTRLFSAATADQWVRHFQTLLRSIVEAPRKRISELCLLTEEERAALVRARSTEAAVPHSPAFVCLPDMFEACAQALPDNTAISMGSQSITYGQLEAEANRLANYLAQSGVGPGTLVALCLERSPAMIISILAVLKAGAGYVPLDPASPPERIAFMLQDCAAPVLVTQSSLAGRFEAKDRKLVLVDSDRAKILNQAAVAPARSIKSEDIAYVIYTSGSTGQPKGVLVSHGNVLRLFHQTQAWFNFNAADVWTLFHSYTFDFSVWEMWGALLYGGRLVLVPYLVSRSPADFYELLAAEKVTVLNQTPSAFRQLIWAETKTPQPRPLHLRYIVCGGEALELRSLAPWFERHGDRQPKVVNMYGITETTVHVTYRVITKEDVAAGLGSVIGVPIPDLALYLVDEHLEPVPPGVPGEICVSGAGVARGYLNRPELTQARFVPDPFSITPCRMYRSGDLARRGADGELEYLGRMDDQVKIRGFRIELGEVESALNSHPAIRESTVLASSTSGESSLVAYVVPTGSCPPAEELRQHLAQSLPDYMIPAVFVPLPALPLTPNGKVDRKALPPPVPEVAAATPRTPPRNDMEILVARTWSELLGRPGIGVHDNFFHCGGHSLLATQAISRLSAALDLELPVRLIFEAPTVAGLAEILSQARHAEQGHRALVKPVAGPNPRELLSRLDQLTDAEVDQLLVELGSKQI